MTAEHPCTWIEITPCINQRDCLGCRIPNTLGYYRVKIGGTKEFWEQRWIRASEKEKLLKRHVDKIQQCLEAMGKLAMLPTEPGKE